MLKSVWQMMNATAANGTAIVIIIDNSAGAIASMTFATLVVFTVVISLALFIALPPGFCSRRARWFRTITHSVQGAGKVLIEEIRGEEEVPIGSDEDDENDEEGEWVHVKKKEKARAQLSTEQTKTVLNHDQCNPVSASRLPDVAYDDPIQFARAAGASNANKTGSGDVYF